MKLYFLRLALVFMVLLPITFITAHIDDSVNSTVIILAALGALLIDFLVEIGSKRFTEPKVNVNVKMENNEHNISVLSSQPLEALAIDLPVLGQIKNIHDNNSVTDGRTTIKQILGSNTGISQNNIEFYIENIKPKAQLQYKVLFQPLPMNIFIGGTDRYKVSYSWHVGGEQRTKTTWFSLETGKEVEPPNVIVKGATFYNRALTPEEIKKEYEDGLKRHKLDT